MGAGTHENRYRVRIDNYRVRMIRPFVSSSKLFAAYSTSTILGFRSENEYNRAGLL